MRVDHFAYQRATRVTWAGFLLQAAMGVGLLLFSLLSGEQGDTALLFGSLYVLCGPLVWLSLVVLFHQHRLERLEALEEDELAATREGTSSIFDASRAESRVAARRLRLMHQWLMPAVSLVLAAAMALLGWWMLARLAAYYAIGEAAIDAGEFAMTPQLGWAVAICLALAALSFIFSRFVAGMAQQPAWQNLRGGAGSMVGNSVVLFAIATGVVFRFFDNDRVIEGIAYAIPFFLFVLALEIALNLVLNLYRPRIPGETPRPAFDSRLLSILAAPDTLVRSINEAINYQFGFDVTSTWGYQLLMRSLLRLFVIGLMVILLLSSMVIIEPHQQGVLLTGGRIAGDEVHGSGLVLKLPWPFQTAEVRDVSRVHTLALTAQRTEDERRHASVWTRRLDGHTDREVEPFLVRRGGLDLGELVPGVVADIMLDRPESPDSGADQASSNYSLVDAEISLQYRIQESGQGLLDYLRFAPDTTIRREPMKMRERVLRSIALREVSLYFSTLTLDQALSGRRTTLGGDLQRRIQAAYDRHAAGVEIVAVSVPLLRPAGSVADAFEDLMMAREDAAATAAKAEQVHIRTLTYLVGDAERAEGVLEELDRYLELEKSLGQGAPEVTAQGEHVERLLRAAGGVAGQQIAAAETDRWIKIMSERAAAGRVAGQLAVYRAAPDLYRERELMRALETLASKRKYVIAVAPERVSVDVEFQELNPYLTQFNKPLSEQKDEENKK